MKFIVLENTKKVSRSTNPEVFLRKGVLNICNKFTGEHPCRSAISIKLLCNFIEIALRHGCSPVYFLRIFQTPFPRNTSDWLLLNFVLLYNQRKKFNGAKIQCYVPGYLSTLFKTLYWENRSLFPYKNI